MQQSAGCLTFRKSGRLENLIADRAGNPPRPCAISSPVCPSKRLADYPMAQGRIRKTAVFCQLQEEHRGEQSQG